MPYAAFIPTGTADFNRVRNSLDVDVIDMADFRMNRNPWTGREFKLDWTLDGVAASAKFITVQYSGSILKYIEFNFIEFIY